MRSAPRLVMSVINDLTGDQRVHRIASTLQAAGYEVWVIGRQLPDSVPLTKRPYRTVRMRLWTHRGKFFYLEYNIRLFFRLLRMRVKVLNANDLDTLLANFLVARFQRIPLIYDSHEYFTEVPELIDRSATRRVWLALERYLLPRVPYMYTVNPSLAQVYSKLYKRTVTVVRNLPFAKAQFEKHTYANILIYQGSVNVGRGIDLMIETMAHLPTYVLWIVGKGDILDEVKALTTRLKLTDRVVFHGFVPFERLSALTQQAKVGFSLEEDRGLNYHYASPNKVYDYIQAHVPVIASDLPEMAALVHHYEVGMTLKESERSPQKLAAMVRALCEPETYQRAVSQCKVAALELTWEQEQPRLLEIYRQAYPPKTTHHSE